MNRFSEENTSVGLANAPSTNGPIGDVAATPHPRPSPPRGEGSCGPSPPQGEGSCGQPSTNGPDGEVGTAAGELETASGRDGQGRFTEEDIDAIVDRLLQQAKDGDVASIKVLLSYVIGKPAPAVDPDTLDVQEWQTQRQQTIAPKDLSVLLNGVPAETAVPVMRVMMPALGQNFADTLLGQMADRGWPEALPYVKRPAASSAPSENGRNGPSANRTNGGRKKQRHQKTAALKGPRPARKR